jgi:hypothetical protein
VAFCRTIKILQDSKSAFWSSKKNLQKDVDVNNVVFYQHAEFRLLIVYILGHTKMTNSDRFEVLHCSLLSLIEKLMSLILYSLSIKFVSTLISDWGSTKFEWQNIIYTQIWFQFLLNFKMQFWNFPKNNLHVARATFVVSEHICRQCLAVNSIKLVLTMVQCSQSGQQDPSSVAAARFRGTCSAVQACSCAHQTVPPPLSIKY